jgi:hypothetical protein
VSEKRGKDKSSRTNRTGTVIAAVVVLVALLVIFISILSIGDAVNDSTTPLIVTVVGFISTTVVSLLALARIEDTKRDLNNGAVKEPVRQAVEEAFDSADRPGMRIAVREALAELLEEHLQDDNDTTAPPVLRVERKERRKNGH